MQKELTDIELINLVLVGNQSAYASLVKRHQRYAFTLALRFTKSREDAEEISQDAFVKVYKSLASFQQQSKFTTWLYQIVYTTSMTFLRRKKIKADSIDDDAVFTQINLLSSDMKLDSTEQKSRSYYVNLAINQLLPDDATIITLFYQGEQSLEEIAQVIGMETNTVKVKLHRARYRLKEKLEGMLKTGSEGIVMNQMEEQLWNYIDGFCTEEERKAIEKLLEEDENYRHKYAELSAFEANIPALNLEEPSMGFTYKVMESIRAEHARVPLKTHINTGIIRTIGAFFICTILVVLGFVFVNVDLSAPSQVHLPEIKILPITNYLNPVVVKGFLFFDVILGLFILDHYFRKFFIQQK